MSRSRPTRLLADPDIGGKGIGDGRDGAGRHGDDRVGRGSIADKTHVHGAGGAAVDDDAVLRQKLVVAGITDRGVIREGAWADLNVIDWDALRLELPTYEPGPATCPRCADGSPLHVPGSSGTGVGPSGA